MKKKSSKELIADVIEITVKILEIVASLIIVIVAIALLVNVIKGIFDGGKIAAMDSPSFSTMVGELLAVTVGLEFVKLLVRHQLQDVLQVLMLAIARQMVVEHLTMVQMLVGVISLAMLFGARRYLFTPKKGKPIDEE